MRYGAWRGLLLAATLGSAGAGATAAEGYDLAKVRHMDGFVGSARARELLARQGMVVTDLAFRQVFVPYTTHAMMAGMPVFITTDSAWSGYHVLLELGLHRLEEIQSRRLEAFSRRLTALALARAHGDGAYLDLARFAAVGLVLQNPAAQASLDSRVRADVEKLAAALGRGNGPVQVGFVELPVAAGRLRASGIYTGEGALARYFAARQWYALCVFRSESVEETRRAFRLAFLVCGDDELHRTWQRLTAPYDAMLGPTEDGSVEQYAAIARKLLGDRAGGNGVDRKIRALQDEAAKLPPPLVNDQRLDDPAYARFGRETCGLRLLGPRRIPSGVVFQQTVDPRIPGRFLPSALDFLAVGPLASPAGQRALRQASQDPKVADLILQAKAPLLPDSLHSRTLRALALLQGPVPKAAPAALRSPAWRDKQLATQMAAWAQQRHTWALHTKVGETAWGGPPGAPGIIAPYPEFFAALAALSRATARELAWATRPDEKGLRAAARRMKEEVAQSRKAIRPGRKLGKDAWELQAARRLVHICCGPGQAVSLDSMRQGLASLEKLADKCAAGEPIQRDEHTVVMLFADGWRSEIFDSPANMDRRNVPGLLRQFALFCDSLAEICRAQLVGKPLTGEQWQTLGTYGVTLARFHLHGDAAYAWPRDDAPQMAPLFHRARPPAQVLYGGVGRPEAIFVIAEVDSQPTLHVGGVLSFRELTRPAGETITDKAWHGMIDQGRDPPAPAFMRSYRAELTQSETLALFREATAGRLKWDAETPAGQWYHRAMTSPKLCGEELIQALLAGMRDKTPRVRSLSAQWAGGAGAKDPRVAKALVGLLDDEDESVAARAVETLATARPPGAGEALLRRLKKGDRRKQEDTDRSPRQPVSGELETLVIAALAELRHRPALEHFTGMVRRDQHPGDVLRAMAAISPDTAMEMLLAIVKDEKAEPSTRSLALQGIEGCATPVTLPRLVELLEDTTKATSDQQVRYAAARGIMWVLAPGEDYALPQSAKARDAEIDRIRKLARARLAKGTARPPTDK